MGSPGGALGWEVCRLLPNIPLGALLPRWEKGSFTGTGRVLVSRGGATASCSPRLRLSRSTAQWWGRWLPCVYGVARAGGLVQAPGVLAQSGKVVRLRIQGPRLPLIIGGPGQVGRGVVPARVKKGLPAMFISNH